MSFGTIFKTTASKGITPQKGMEELNSIAAMQQQQVIAALAEAADKLTPPVRAEVVASYHRAGIGKSDPKYKSTGTMLSVLNALKVRTGQKGFVMDLPPKVAYPDGKGNVYAAIGSLVYGAVRQPLTKEAGSDYHEFGKDSQRVLQRKKAAGVLGAKAKQSVKSSYFDGAIDRQKAGGKQGEVGAGISVVKPRLEFFILNPSQKARFAALADVEIRRALFRRGIRIPPPVGAS